MQPKHTMRKRKNYLESLQILISNKMDNKLAISQLKAENERLKAVVSKQEELLKIMDMHFGTANVVLNKLKSELEKLKAE